MFEVSGKIARGTLGEDSRPAVTSLHSSDYPTP
jgi:hypothetical protein